MKVSVKGKNAVKLLLDLANHNDGTPVRLKDIARRQSISVKYLEQTASLLQKASLVQSVKGTQGGYLLRYPPESYTMRRILDVTEGNLSPSSADTTAEHDGCVSDRVWEKLDKAIYDTLEGITLADLLDWQNEMVDMGQYSI